jgi:hypothetical protein
MERSAGTFTHWAPVEDQREPVPDEPQHSIDELLVMLLKGLDDTYEFGQIQSCAPVDTWRVDGVPVIRRIRDYVTTKVIE